MLIVQREHGTVACVKALRVHALNICHDCLGITVVA